MVTAYVTDTRFAAHTLTGHAEFAGRLTAVQDLLTQYGLPARMLELAPLEPSQDLLLSVHTEDYLKLLAWTETQKGMQLGPDTYVLPASFGVAKLSAGGVIRAVDAVLSGQANNALAAIRPPGHHATPQMGMGFCLLSNIALAARYAQQNYGLNRIMIVDYDVHHGNGTQDVFYDDPDVLFLSTHQYPWYPGTGSVHETGAGKGSGTTINVPVPAGTGNDGYAHIFERIVWPAARRFAPQLILVSAGFDAHWADPLGQIKLSLTGYDTLTRQLIEMANILCDGKIVFVLEGGYNLTSLSHGVLNVANALLGESQLIDPLGESGVDETGGETNISELIAEVVDIHTL